MKDSYHIVPKSYDDDGFPVWQTPLTPTGNTKKAMVVAPPDHVIPVIFIPGIMGSNLKIVNEVKKVGKKRDAIAWRPDLAGASDASQWASTRQLTLDAKNTVVDTRCTVDGKSKVSPMSGMSMKCAESRGWGSVFWGSYGDVLRYLESNLNLPCFYEPSKDKVLINSAFRTLLDTGITLPGQPPLKLRLSDIEHMSEYWFPVHAFGYNWLQSNEDAGIALSREITRIIGFYQKKLRYPGACQKVILITHSMGGLVSRAAVHPKIGNAEANVLGIVHGVMPAIGAAAAYKRMRTGFERGEINWFSLGSMVGEYGPQWVSGRNGHDVTAVLGHAPGGLQLLPNKAYQPEGWLKMTGVDAQPYVVPMNGNPYASIYREQNKWWRLINPDWLDPAGRFKNPRVTPWGSFDAALTQAENFHSKLAHHYHPNTYCFYGADAQHHPAYGAVIWQKVGEASQFDEVQTVGPQPTNAELMKDGVATLLSDNGRGSTIAQLKLTSLSFKMTKAQDAGDGTVPASSGAAPHRFARGCVRAQLAIAGIDHQGAFSTSHQSVMDFVGYSVCKMSRDII